MTIKFADFTDSPKISLPDRGVFCLCLLCQELFAVIRGGDAVALLKTTGEVKLIAKPQLLADLFQACGCMQQTFGLAEYAKVDIVPDCCTQFVFKGVTQTTF